MQNFRDGKLPEAVQLLKHNSVLSVDSLQTTITSQMKAISPKYGEMLSYEFISEHKIKNFIAKRYYILKFDRFYLKFDFTLYNNGKGWTITGLSYDEELLELLY